MFVTFLLSVDIVLVLGSSLNDQVHQTPAHMFKNNEENAKIHCSHSIDGYDRILWYKQIQDGQLQFLGYMFLTSDYPESGVKVKIKGSASKGEMCTLTVEELSIDSSAVYYCAASQESLGEPAYFGQGTKLTVLGPGLEVTKPEVKILKPSPNECRNKKDEAKKKTLVCLAYGFYPDHVTVSWKVNGEVITNGVATDSAAKKNETYYSITSRLRVSADDWHNPKNVFKCIVHFFNGKNTPEYSDEIHGIESSTEGESAEAGIPREEYLKVTQNAKLSFTVLIFKGLVYGVFVAFLILKLQGSSGKQSS